jgi:hypothetical protein
MSRRARPLAHTALALASMLGLARCGPASATCTLTSDAATLAPDADPFSVGPQCTSGRTWACGNTGVEFMNPGQACVNCHRTRPGAPVWKAGGTVYQTLREPDNCLGPSSPASDPVKIFLTDSAGVEHSVTMRPGGNFYFPEIGPPPYRRIRVEYQGRTQFMPPPAPHGDCNLCHTQMGIEGAPGRIVLP